MGVSARRPAHIRSNTLFHFRSSRKSRSDYPGPAIFTTLKTASNLDSLSGSAPLMAFWVYILANYSDGPMYVGHTDDLARRIWEHREGVHPGFTRRYRISRLVWMEAHDTRESAFERERSLKRWRREWKNALVRQINPDWADLYDTLNGGVEWTPAVADPGQPGLAGLPG